MEVKVEPQITRLRSAKAYRADLLQYTGFIQNHQNVIDTRTGEIITAQQFDERQQAISERIKSQLKGKEI